MVLGTDPSGEDSQIKLEKIYIPKDAEIVTSNTRNMKKQDNMTLSKIQNFNN
jgi:hypothetical protein